MARRAGALLGIVFIVSLVLMLIWRVYTHHENAGSGEETTIVLRAGASSPFAA